MVKKAFEQLFRIGPLNLVWGLIERGRNRKLQKLYGFDPWHVTGTYHVRPYKRVALELVESVDHGVVMDLGGGLGDIISRTSAQRRILADLCPKVLQGAEHIHGSKLEYLQGDFGTLPKELDTRGVKRIDVLVMMNWPHGLPGKELFEGLGSFLRAVPCRYLVTDLMYHQTNPQFVRHCAADYETIGRIVAHVDGRDGARNVILVELNAT